MEKKKKKKRRKYDMTVPITYFTALLFSVETNSPMLYEYKWWSLIGEGEKSGAKRKENLLGCKTMSTNINIPTKPGIHFHSSIKAQLNDKDLQLNKCCLFFFFLEIKFKKK